VSAEASHLHHAPPAPVGGKLVTPTTIALAVMMFAALGVLAYRFVYGLGAATNMNQGYPWGLWIAYDVVSGSALAGGGFATALLVYIMNRGEYHPLIRPALLAADLGYVQAGASVMFDLGRWWDFWHIISPSYVNPSSVLFEVALCIMAYLVVMWIEFMPVVMERLGWENPRKKLNRILFIFVGLGVLLPFMHQSSLGTLLVVLGPQVHPLYQSNLLPVMFLTSTIGMGYAAVTIEGAISSTGLRRPFEKEILGKLMQIGRILMGVYLVVRFADVAYRGALSYAFTPSMPMMTFWLENFLFSVPIWLLASQENRNKAKLIFIAAFAMAAAGLIYRLSAFLVAYETGAGWHYFPSLGEMTVTFGLIAFEVLFISESADLAPPSAAHVADKPREDRS